MKRSMTLFFCGWAIALAGISGCAGVGKSASTQTAPAKAAATPAKVAAAPTEAAAAPIEVAAAPTKISAAELTLSTEGELSPGGSIGSIDVSFAVPAGMIVKAEKTSEISAGSVVASGAAKGAIIIGKYTPAEGDAPGIVRSAIIKIDGFKIGEFATVKLDLTGSLPQAADFKITNLAVTDLSGNKLEGITCRIGLKAK